ncbi:aminopeptidase P N-terminal domain-containing protein [Wenzhouxiangella marina]|uniref:Xaa-Pro aminopeptidase n=1 Tax=Wenzhouxiangella marina TaxID=1579979 RepID=A0A0K0XUN0_9GAMM|nr:aminopeptidase P N-terminal domain-containing protein [Wenzhouxiangella marina]AKS41419.1 Xaa-Pro aminopeptidase [Wenzhouxiangella marina]MBB6086827.1 Xaa-Pro aminopeptidase [Wenzhouxiangella marina]
MIKREEFQRRRRRLMTEAGEHALILVPAAPEHLRNGDSHYPYRQDSDFLYLTGLSEPEAVLAMAPGRAGGEQILFCRPRDPERERWDGPRLGLEGAVEQLGVDDAFPIADLDDILPGLMEGCARVYHPVGKDPAFDQRVMDWRKRLREQRRGEKGPGEIVSLEYLLHEQRLVKSREEIRCMQRAARISAQAIVRAMQQCRPGMNESEIMAELLHEYQRNGCPPAYQPIVAGGSNALVLHYISNNQALADGDLLLIDAGCEFDGYAADISRTFPVNGRFTAEQKAAYEVVLSAQAAAIDQVRIGRPFEAYHEAAVRRLTEGLVELGLLAGGVDGLIESEAYRRFYMHKTGHWLGLDVHDVGDYRIDEQSRVLEKNMVVTVEPGLYIGSDDDIPAGFRNIGIRIEDDIRVTDGEPENLTAGVPREVADIEGLMAG